MIEEGGQPLEWLVRNHFLLIGEWMLYVLLVEIIAATFTCFIIMSKFIITPLWISMNSLAAKALNSILSVSRTQNRLLWLC